MLNWVCFLTKTKWQYLNSGSEPGTNNSNGKSSNMLDLLGIDLDNNDADKNGATGADPWGMPIKSQPQPQSQVTQTRYIFIDWDNNVDIIVSIIYV